MPHRLKLTLRKSWTRFSSIHSINIISDQNIDTIRIWFFNPIWDQKIWFENLRRPIIRIKWFDPKSDWKFGFNPQGARLPGNNWNPKAGEKKEHLKKYNHFVLNFDWGKQLKKKKKQNFQKMWCLWASVINVQIFSRWWESGSAPQLRFGIMAKYYKNVHFEKNWKFFQKKRSRS